MREHERAITGHTPDVRIEPVRWRDLSAVARVQRASFRPGLAYGLGALMMLRLTPGVAFLVAHTPDHGVAGCVIADIHRGNARVMNIAVSPDARRQGIGTALLREVDRVLPGGDLVLMAEEWNTHAQALYSREGFVPDGRAQNYYGRGRHGIWMRKIRGRARTMWV